MAAKRVIIQSWPKKIRATTTNDEDGGGEDAFHGLDEDTRAWGTPFPPCFWSIFILLGLRDGGIAKY